ncbi:FecR family protein [Aegicerativicinus sediminis]|uniref:FecR family protein n=1 Tax=Aegicerativicinus sediminis TaxID=2893202 RepID=UPI001E4D0387|nr:FecR family protein [Aegicerativicinus sediminis]
MNKSHLHTLIDKYIANSLTPEEEFELEQSAKDPENLEVIKQQIRDHVYINKALVEFNAEKALRKFESNKTNKVIRLPRLLKYAAILIGITLVSGFLFKTVFFNASEGIEALDKLEIVDNNVQLILGNGNVTNINLSSNDSINLNSNGASVLHNTTQISYANLISNEDSLIETLVYNELKVPYGKKFTIELSDGTDVYLNAGSSIKFPIKFLEGLKREVFITGEAYFDVTKDQAHPFIVNTGDMAVEVLGTSFNVSNYPEDASIDVVLEEGSVALSNTASSSILKLVPGEKGSLAKNGSATLTKEEVNTKVYTGWRDGRLTFRNISFKNIIPKLEREYNVEVINNNKDLNEENFYASFNEEDIKVVLGYFQESFDLKFNVDKNKITIK